MKIKLYREEELPRSEIIMAERELYDIILAEVEEECYLLFQSRENIFRMEAVLRKAGARTFKKYPSDYSGEVWVVVPLMADRFLDVLKKNGYVYELFLARPNRPRASPPLKSPS